MPRPSRARAFMPGLSEAYTRALVGAMHHRMMTTAVALIVIGSSVPLYQQVRQEYVPSDADEAEFEVNVTAPEGTSVAGMNEVMQLVENDLRSIPGVRLVLSSLGGSFLGAVNNGSVYVRIAPHEERVFSIARLWHETLRGRPWAAFRGNYSQRDVMQEVRRKMSQYPDLRTSVRNATSFNIGGGNFDIDFVIRGPELEQLARFAEQLRVKSQTLGGILDTDTTLKLNKPELQVEIDRTRAADLGVEMEDIASALRLMVGGDQRVSRFRDASVSDDYDVQLRLTEGDRSDTATISRLFVPGSAGRLVRLDNLVQIVPATSPSRIDRLDRQRQASLRGSVGPGYALADRLAALRQAVAEMNLPVSYTTAVSGRGRELERTFTEFLWAFLLSIIFMYMILAFPV